MPNLLENYDVTSQMTDVQNSLITLEDITVPGMSDDEKNEKSDETSSPRGGKYNLRPTPP